jgi:hypothetical protein
MENIRVKNAQIKLRQHITVKQGKMAHGKHIKENIHHRHGIIRIIQEHINPKNGISAIKQVHILNSA